MRASQPLSQAGTAVRLRGVQSRPKPRGRSMSRASRSRSHTSSRRSAVRESARTSGSWSRLSCYSACRVQSSARAAAHRAGRDFARADVAAERGALAARRSRKRRCRSAPFSEGEDHPSPIVTPLRNGAPAGVPAARPPTKGPPRPRLGRDLRGQGLAGPRWPKPRRLRRQPGRLPTTAATAGHRPSWGLRSGAGSPPSSASSSGVRSIRALPATYDASGDSSSRAGTAAAKCSQYRRTSASAGWSPPRSEVAQAANAATAATRAIATAARASMTRFVFALAVNARSVAENAAGPVRLAVDRLGVFSRFLPLTAQDPNTERRRAAQTGGAHTTPAREAGVAGH